MYDRGEFEILKVVELAHLVVRVVGQKELQIVHCERNGEIGIAG